MEALDLRQRVLCALEAQAAAHEVDIVDVEISGAKSAPVISVRIDHADESLPTISLDEVTQESAWISALIEELDPVSSRYVLEVSSPGMARPLRRAHDFDRFAGNDVRIVTTATEGRRSFTGRLEGMRGDAVVLLSDEGEFELPLATIKSAHIKPHYDIGKGSKK